MYVKNTTVGKFKDFIATKILREIKFGNSRSSKTAILVIFVDFWAIKKAKTGCFSDPQFGQIWFYVKSERAEKSSLWLRNKFLHLIFLMIFWKQKDPKEIKTMRAGRDQILF